MDNYEYVVSRLDLRAAQLAEFYMWMVRMSSTLIDYGKQVGPRSRRVPASFTMSELTKFAKVLKDSNLADLFKHKLDRLADSLIPRFDNGDDLTEQGQQTLNVIKHYNFQKDRLLTERAAFVELLESKFGIFPRSDREREASVELIMLSQAAYIPYSYDDQKNIMHEKFGRTTTHYNYCSKAWYFPRTGVVSFET
jgi:hypothetical protein